MRSFLNTLLVIRESTFYWTFTVLVGLQPMECLVEVLKMMERLITLWLFKEL